MAGGLRGRGLLPRPGHYSQNLSTPPKKIHGAANGVSGSLRGCPQEQGPILGSLGSWGFFWAWRGIRGPHRVPQQPLPDPQQVRRLLQLWPRRPFPAACPKWVSLDKTNKTWYFKTVPEDWTRLKTCLWGHDTALLAVICGLDPRERALSWSQRRPAACMSELRTAALISPRTVACLREPRPAAWASSSPRTWLWSCEWRRWYPCGRRTRCNPAELLRFNSGLGRDYEQRLPCRGTHRNKQKLKKTENKTVKMVRRLLPV